MGQEVDNFDAHLAERRHKELLGSLRGILSELGKDKTDNGIKDAIDRQRVAIDGFASAIMNIPKPEINTSNGHEEIINALQQFSKEIRESNDSVIQAIKNRPIVESFDITNRDYNGFVKQIKVNYKKSN